MGVGDLCEDEHNIAILVNQFEVALSESDLAARLVPLKWQHLLVILKTNLFYK